MVKWSIVLGVLGLFGTGAVVPYLSKWVSNWGPQYYWLLGLAALFPAWLIAFLGLLGLPAGERVEGSLPLSAILFSGAALLGVIFTEMAVRRLNQSGYFVSSLIYWLLGLAALFPAWCIAVWNLL